MFTLWKGRLVQADGLNTNMATWLQTSVLDSWSFVALCCFMLPYVALCCPMLGYVAPCCTMLPYVPYVVLSPGLIIATFQRNIVRRVMLRSFGHHVATCCDLLRHVGCWWLKSEDGQVFHQTFVDAAWCCSRLGRFVQQCCARACGLVQFSTRNINQSLFARVIIV